MDFVLNSNILRNTDTTVNKKSEIELKKKNCMWKSIKDKGKHENCWNGAETEKKTKIAEGTKIE